MAKLTTSVDVDLDSLAGRSLDMERRGLTLFGLEVRQHRVDEEISMRELAEEVLIRQDIISRIESGLWCPSLETELVLREWMART